jgi:hypothetical protein
MTACTCFSAMICVSASPILSIPDQPTSTRHFQTFGRAHFTPRYSIANPLLPRHILIEGCQPVFNPSGVHPGDSQVLGCRRDAARDKTTGHADRLVPIGCHFEFFCVPLETKTGFANSFGATLKVASGVPLGPRD